MGQDLLTKLIAALAPMGLTLLGGFIAAWAIMREQGKRNDESIKQLKVAFTELSSRIDAKNEKIVLTLSSVQNVAEESMRQIRAAWARLEDDSQRAAKGREEQARLDEQLKNQKEALLELKRTQELRLDDVLRAIAKPPQ